MEVDTSPAPVAELTSAEAAGGPHAGEAPNRADALPSSAGASDAQPATLGRETTSHSEAHAEKKQYVRVVAVFGYLGTRFQGLQK